jgi:hypothetical protein
MGSKIDELATRYKQNSGKPLYLAAPRIDVHLSDGTVYSLASLEVEVGEGVLTALAWGDPPRVVSIPYEVIVKVEAYEPPKEEGSNRIIGFQPPQHESKT